MRNKFKIGIVEYDIDTIINKHVKVDARDEAKEIISNTLEHKPMGSDITYRNIVELIIYHLEDIPNLICSHLDYMKKTLVDEGIMVKGGNFGYDR